MKIIAVNKKAYFNYFISDELEVGIALEGSEVKSARAGHVSIGESFVKISAQNEAFLQNAYFKPYENASVFVPDSRRNRKLLLHKKQILNLKKKTEADGFTIVPLKIYFDNNGRVKLQIGLGKGKKLYDKRETLKTRTIERTMNRFRTN